MRFHLLLFILKINLCPSIELHQIECDKGNFLAIMMSVQPVSTQGMEMSLGTGKGNSNRHHDTYNERKDIQRGVGGRKRERLVRLIRSSTAR